MWFASIWIFTLRLPWELGADFFLRHLIDGDPASNTLAWRWVAGIQTKGRPYIARVSNISKFTNGRFCPTHQITTNVTPIDDASDHLRKRLPDAAAPADVPNEFLLVVTEDDMQIVDALPHAPVATIGALATTGGSPLPVAELAQRFASGAMQDACGGTVVINQNAWANEIIEACERYQTKTVVTGYAPIGPTATALAEAHPDLTAAGINLIQVRRSFDTIAWPHATKGFFAMKKAVPSVLEKLGITH